MVIEAQHYAPPGLYRVKKGHMGLRLFAPRQNDPSLPDGSKRTLINAGDVMLITDTIRISSKDERSETKYLYPLLFEDRKLFAIFYEYESLWELFEKIDAPNDHPEPVNK